MADRGGANPISDCVLFTCGAAHPVVVYHAAVSRRAVQRPAPRMEGQTSVRRFDSGQLPARIRAQQLAESCPAASLADLLVRCFVRHALACLRRGHGHRAGPLEWPADDRNNSGESALQISNCRISWRRNYFSVDLFSRLDHRGLPTPGSPVVLAGRNFCLERARLYAGRNAPIHVGLEHCRIPGHVLELGARLAHEGCWRDLDKSTNLQIYKKQAECSSGARDSVSAPPDAKFLHARAMPSVPGGEGMSARPDRPRELPGRLRGCFAGPGGPHSETPATSVARRFPGRPSKSLEGTIASEGRFSCWRP